MRSLLSQLLAVGPELAAFILTSPLLGSRGAYAISQAVAPSPNLDTHSLGRVAVAGDFDSLSLYNYEGQTENVVTNNGSNALLTQYGNGMVDTLAQSDAYIETMCSFVQNGNFQGVVVGGNFTSLGGVQAQSIALWNPDTNEVTPLPGINGKVNALYCDNDAGIVYVGGMFSASHSYNAMSWTTKWTDLGFLGFNAQVTSITKNAAGNIVWGGEFDGLGNGNATAGSGGPIKADTQVINLAGGTISAEGSSTTDGFSDPNNIICKTGDDGPGNTWLLSDNRGGFWQGSYGFGFVPTKLRLYNTNYEGRGTKSFSFENLANGGVLNLNFIDSNGVNQSCSGDCPLPQGNTTAQDFYFVPPVGMNSFRIWINSWYGDGAGFSGIELFQSDIYSFAVNDFNQPTCDSVSMSASSTLSPADGLWYRVANNGTTSSDYEAAYLTDASQMTSSTNVVFTPSIQQSGNYSITVYTPGCLSDDTCATRGTVNLTGSMTSGNAPITTTITQTNDYDKYDQIYYGFVDVDTDTFMPSVTLSPIAGQPIPQTIVAQRVRFELITTTGGLNGLFEYDPNKVVTNTDFSDSAIDAAGANLDTGAVVNTVISSGNTIYVGGNFSGDGISNIMSVTDKATSLPNSGLNNNVQVMYLDDSTLYVGGNFTNTGDNSVQGLANVAVFDTGSKRWGALGAGVDGAVSNIVPISLNITESDLEQCVAITGDFLNVNGFEGSNAFAAAGFAVWVPSKSNWLSNLPNADIQVKGKLYTQTAVQGMKLPLYAGQISTEALGLGGAAELVGSGMPTLESLGIRLQDPSSSSSSKNKRAFVTSQNQSGVYTGLFYSDNGLNITVLGGHFSASAGGGSIVNNLMFLTGSGSASGISELDSDSTIAALGNQGTLLFAGGALTGTVDGNDLNGLVVYDLKKGALASPQPPALAGDNVVVNAIAAQEDTSFVFVGGDFTEAGSLPCATLCYYDTSVQQWNTPGMGLTGTITSMFWSSKTQLIIAGNLTVGGNQTTMATYDSKKQVYAEYNGGASLPGQISALSPADSSYNTFWAAGVASSNNSAYLAYYSGSRWTGVGGLGPDTVIRSVQILSLTDNHDSTDLVPKDEVLLVVGNINIPSFGNASACLFNGTTFEPFLLTTKNDGSQGSIASMFVENPQALMDMGGHNLAVGFVVLIGLAIALGLIFLIVVAGILIERSRRRREGYIPMSTDKNGHNGNMARIPPETLLGSLNEKGSPTPKI